MARPGDAPTVAQQPVADVEHGRRTSGGRLWSGRERRCGTALALDRDREPVDRLGLQQPQAGVRETERPVHREDVTGPRARSEHRVTVESAEGGDRDHDDPGGRRRQVAAEHRHPGCRGTPRPDPARGRAPTRGRARGRRRG